jgi:hypothetical protein
MPICQQNLPVEQDADPAKRVMHPAKNFSSAGSASCSTGLHKQ